MSPALVTVVIPTYDRPHYLGVALRSVLSQTYANLEIIVADDGSDGRTRAVVESIDDPRIVYRRNERNLGMLRNNVAAFRTARGEFVANLHDDDAWLPELVETLLPPLESDASLVVAFSDHWVMDETGRIDREGSERFSHRWGRDRLPAGVLQPFHGAAVVTHSVPLHVSGIMRKDAIAWSEFPDAIGPVYDLWLAYLVSRDGRGAWYHPGRLACYRVHATQATRQRLSQSRSSVYVRQRLLEDPRLAEHRAALRAQYADACATLAISLLRSGDAAGARSTLRTAIRARPGARTGAALAVAQLPAPMAAAIARRLRWPDSAPR